MKVNTMFLVPGHQSESKKSTKIIFIAFSMCKKKNQCKKKLICYCETVFWAKNSKKTKFFKPFGLDPPPTSGHGTTSRFPLAILPPWLTLLVVTTWRCPQSYLCPSLLDRLILHTASCHGEFIMITAAAFPSQLFSSSYTTWAHLHCKLPFVVNFPNLSHWTVNLNHFFFHLKAKFFPALFTHFTPYAPSSGNNYISSDNFVDWHTYSLPSIMITNGAPVVGTLNLSLSKSLTMSVI